MSTTDADSAFEEHAHAMYGWAYRLLGRHHDALDVVQDVYTKWAAQCRRERPHSPRGWLRQATLRRAIDLVRRRRFAGGPLDQAEPVGLAASGSGGVEPGDMDPLRADIAAALHDLSDAQRAVLSAKVFDEMTFAQIAEETGLAVSTVKTHFARAVRAVRVRLEHRWGVEPDAPSAEPGHALRGRPR